MKSAIVIGLGDICRDDYGAGCYAVDAHLQEPLGEQVESLFFAEVAFYAGACMCGADFAVLIQARV